MIDDGKDYFWEYGFQEYCQMSQDFVYSPDVANQRALIYNRIGVPVKELTSSTA